ncbi:MFS transporter [Actinokineospora globicatena]|uniref:MFS transporter n=1 Tax=Actinokineospora globicatena TaxID=103729 RepID=UPI0020A2FF73|nr:MFS transporter [Actinokineospora globicatena]MCP2301638.1 metabolite-proton symporter [Actinokineospora globicatena]GLW76707.1 MFS transporter [Actinokineospora globicatena]GLW83540.1 MFS transporter [Actinokineospora globicatena]
MSKPFVRIVSASLVGTTIEWYDFFLYTSAAALVFNKLFFPTADPLTGTLLAFLTYAIGFVARPIGGLVFGHYGDKIGRKRLLVLSLLLMGGSTFAMGLLPTYAAIGIGAPLLLTTLRLIQGFALGGEWGGAVLIVSEHGSAERRGFWASWPQCGAPGGNLLATGVLALLAAVQSDATFLAWGWRVPFLLSGVLVLIGLWIRLSVTESPVFLAAQVKAAERAEPHVPVVEVFRNSWQRVLVTIGARMAENVSYYIITAFILVYVTTGLGMAKTVGLNAVMIGSAVHFVSIPLWGALSDRLGRRPVYLFGAVTMAVWAFVFFALLNTRSPGLIIMAATVGLTLHGAMYGPQAAFFSEQFPTRVRYTGLSVGGQLSSIAAGAVAPLIATALFQRYDSTVPVSLYLVGMCTITVIAILAARETRGHSLAEPESVDSPVPVGR